jgi:hypothetical protein
VARTQIGQRDATTTTTVVSVTLSGRTAMEVSRASWREASFADAATVLIEPRTTPTTEADFNGAAANVVTLGRNDFDSE